MPHLSDGRYQCFFKDQDIKVGTISFERPEASPLDVYSPSAIIGLSLLNSILMARFLKQSFAQTYLKETDNGKLQQFNYSRSLITNPGNGRERNWPHCKELLCTTR